MRQFRGHVHVDLYTYIDIDKDIVYVPVQVDLNCTNYIIYVDQIYVLVQVDLNLIEIFIHKLYKDIYTLVTGNLVHFHPVCESIYSWVSIQFYTRIHRRYRHTQLYTPPNREPQNINKTKKISSY